MIKKRVDEELFPHSGFPYRLEYQEGKEVRKCWFDSDYNRKKYIDRYKLNKRTHKIQLSDKP